MDSVINHAQLGDITVSVSRRARRISIRVRPGGEVCLTLPPRVSLREGLSFLESKRDWVARAKARMARTAATAEPALSPQTIEMWRAQAKATLPGRLEQLARHHGFAYAGVTIRNSRTRWGSCSARNDISLSLRLMRLPGHLIDYILLHELCHTRIKNHGPKFHALLDRVTGGRDAQLRKELRAYR